MYDALSSATNRKINQKYLFITSQSMYEPVSSITFCVLLRHPGSYPPSSPAPYASPSSPSTSSPSPPLSPFASLAVMGLALTSGPPSHKSISLCIFLRSGNCLRLFVVRREGLKVSFVMPFHFIRSFFVCAHFAHFPQP